MEQWFSILQRKRLRIADFASKTALQAKIEQFLVEWNAVAHPFNWCKQSVAKLMADPLDQGDRILSCSGEHRQKIVFVETTKKAFLPQAQVV